jgi:hypothetical protein
MRPSSLGGSAGDNTDGSLTLVNGTAGVTLLREHTGIGIHLEAVDDRPLTAAYGISSSTPVVTVPEVLPVVRPDFDTVSPTAGSQIDSTGVVLSERSSSSAVVQSVTSAWFVKPSAP